PANEFVFRFIGESSCLSAMVDERGINFSGEPMQIPCLKDLPHGAVRLFFRPSWLCLGAPAEQCDNRIPARLKFSEFLGDIHRYHLDVGGSVLVADRRSPLESRSGDPVTLGWNSNEMVVFH
ncbi:MAG: putative spermidine/putrescine transport system ATP-binding protein, partial [Rhodospirillaceae bacterium]|nr:putative spermidine/putrescine transport system ATP-binding protein [Rhodospirillaceae bacterium]